MHIDIKLAPLLDTSAEALAIVFFEEDVKKAAVLDKALRGLLDSLLGKDFKAKKNETYFVPMLGRQAPKRIVLCGLGKKAKFDADGLRQIAGVVSKQARGMGIESVNWDGASLQRLPGKTGENFRALAEGVGLGLYRFDKLKSVSKDDSPKDTLKKVQIVFSSREPAGVRQALDKGSAMAEAVSFTRDMVASPANYLTPTDMARAAENMSKARKIRCKILKKQEIERLKMHSFLSVTQGSSQGPRFIILEYRGGKASAPPVVLVGKGITFDSGGISLKPALDMDKMKYDMAGGATVIGVLDAVARLRLPINVVGLVPAAENLPSGTATKPGDVVRASNGKTIEVLNTDAEGRLVLADALVYAARYKPKAVIDLATLTGACVVALGSLTCAVLGNDEKLIHRIKKASTQSQERAWELPLWDEYSEFIKSDVADIKNIGGGGAGTITAAAFLKEFVGKYPWAHLDIAGVAWADAEKPYIPKGASGFGVRLLTTLLEDWK